MGTNFYLRKKVSNKDKEELLSYLDSKYAELRKQVNANPYGLRYALDDFYYEWTGKHLQIPEVPDREGSDE